MKNENNNYCTLYIVRHGLTEWNIKGIVQGQSDIPLSPEGEKQVQEVAQKFKDIHFDAIFSSDLLRTKRTAEIIKLDRELAIQTSHLLRERNYGKFEGKHKEEYQKATKHIFEEIQKLSDEEQYKFKFDKDTESDEELMSRFITKLREIAVAYSGKTVLIVAHGGVIRTFLIHMGYAKRNDLPIGSFKNSGYAKVLSDGIDFFIKEVEGIKNNKNSE